MRFLVYAGLDPGRLQHALDKVRVAIERDDFKSADVKKLQTAPYYRAKLDGASRLLLTFVRHDGETACLALEVIAQHAYDHSRFLRGARLDPARVGAATAATIAADAAPARHLHPGRSEFHLLDRPLSFDDAQEAVYRLPAPLILVGSAGSGKTALALTKLRQAEGEVLYVTQSPWLARNARDLYFANGYENPAQEPQFLSWRELLETLRVPPGREVDFAAFRKWFERHRQHYRDTDAHQCFEEFRGVIGSQPEGILSCDAYLALGLRQSIFPSERRAAIHDLFVKYRAWLTEAGLYDGSLIAHAWQALAAPHHDFIAIDEVQDFTNVQLALVLRTLRQPSHFLLCGDSNQIVHPNFFAWSAVKSLFWRDPGLAERQALSVLGVNYRNARAVTQLANNLLKVKHARFGSIDRESNHLVEAVRAQEGEVRLLPDTAAARRDIDARTRGSTQCAVLVLRDEDKPAARACFHTPLVFSVHEAKGLEYPTIVLYDLVSGHRQAYAEVCAGVDAADLAVASIEYRRAKDKQDKSLEIWKFYVNALYVAITRAVERVWMIERDTAHPLLGLLGLRDNPTALGAAEPASSRADWEREAHRLELHGKQEQAAAIRATALHTAKVPWQVWNEAAIAPTIARALNPKEVSNKLRQQVLDFALWHHQEHYVEQLAKEARWGPAIDLNAHAGRIERAAAGIAARQLAPWTKKSFKDVLEQCDQYGVDYRGVFDATPLMMAAQAGNLPLVEALLARGADLEARDLFGQTPVMFALERAALHADYARGPFGDVYARVAPPELDVETDGHLVRLYPHQGEYFVLLTMLAGIKTLGSQLVPPDACSLWHRLGFTTSWLMRNVKHLPASVLHEERRKRTWFNAVLARAEVTSSYLPARRLWLRLQRGHYVPNPTLRLRVHDASGQDLWQPVHAVMAVRRVLAGNGYGATIAALETLLPAAEREMASF